MSEDDTTLLIAEIDAAAGLIAQCFTNIDPVARPSFLQLGNHLAHIRRTMVQEQQRTAEIERRPIEAPRTGRRWAFKKYVPIDGPR